MRKVSREMSAEWAYEVQDKAPYITMSMIRDGKPYAVPLSMAREGSKLYFHCAQEGDKLDALRANPEVWLSAVSRCHPVVGPKDNSFTLEYASAMAEGRGSVVSDHEERLHALRLISQRFLPHHMDAFPASAQRSLERVCICRIDLTGEPTGKRKQYDAAGEEMKYGRMQ